MLYLLIAICFIAVIIPFLIYKLSPVKNAATHKVKIIGHRGAAGLAPENTMAAFKKALDLSVDIIELDIHLTSDDSIVVIHDYDVKRTTNGKGKVDSFNYDEIKKLDAGSWFGEAFKNEKIPTLNEVLNLVNGKAKTLIEIKWPSKGIYNKLVPLLIQTIKEHQAESWVIVQSFEPEYIKQINESAPGIECHQLLFGKAFIVPLYFGKKMFTDDSLSKEKISSLNIFYLYSNKYFVDKMHKQGLSVNSYTINNIKDMRKAASLGVDGIITDRPDIALKILRNQ